MPQKFQKSRVLHFAIIIASALLLGAPLTYLAGNSPTLPTRGKASFYNYSATLVTLYNPGPGESTENSKLTLSRLDAVLVVWTTLHLKQTVTQLRQGKPTIIKIMNCHNEKYRFGCRFNSEFIGVDLLKEIVETNPWNSTFFFWIDLNIPLNKLSDKPVPNLKWPDLTKVEATFSQNQDAVVLGSSDQMFGDFPTRWISNEDPMDQDIISPDFLGGTKPAISWWASECYRIAETYRKENITVPTLRALANAVTYSNWYRVLILQPPSASISDYFFHYYRSDSGFSIPADARPPFIGMSEYLCNGVGIPNAPKYGVFTMLTGMNDMYVRGVEVLGKSLKKHMNFNSVGIYLLLQKNDAYQPRHLKRVTDAGWEICYVPRIPPPTEDATFPRFADQFTKLALFSMTEFERIVYLDADTLVVSPFLELLEDKRTDFLAARSWGGGEFRPSFNMGVFSVIPNQQEFWRLFNIRLVRLDYPLRMAEQAFLNTIYMEENRWIELAWCYNANIAIYCYEPETWEALSKQCAPKIIHYTTMKPFDPDFLNDSAYEECKGIIDDWHQRSRELEKEETLRIAA